MQLKYDFFSSFLFIFLLLRLIVLKIRFTESPSLHFLLPPLCHNGFIFPLIIHFLAALVSILATMCCFSEASFIFCKSNMSWYQTKMFQPIKNCRVCLKYVGFLTGHLVFQKCPLSVTPSVG